tara:strand:+ start:574 stop:798 length:225 start_codon:yes stop_codon:yes gene_type:complete
MIKRALKDLYDSGSAEKSSSLRYIFSDKFSADCKACAVDQNFIRAELKESLAHEGIRRKVLIDKMIIKLMAYNY